MGRLLLLAGVLALVASSLALFVLREDDPVASADAVVVLSGGRARLPVALGLIERGVAPVLVVSEGRVARRWRAPGLCDRRDLEILCPTPDSDSTRGEARMIARLARERGWDSLVVVTSRFHLFRARLLLERCFHGRLAMAGAESPAWRLPYELAWEWAKLARAEIPRGC